jgi:hypothetical protein
MLFIFIIVVGFTLIGGIIKYFRTRELSSKLGRNVGDHELVSLNSWIEAEKNVDKKNQASN